MLRARISLIGGLALLTAVLVAPSASQAVPATPLCAADDAVTQAADLDGNAQADRLNLKIAQMRQEGRSQEEIDKDLAKQGVVLVSEPATNDGVVQPQSSGSDVSPSANIYRDTCSTRWYIIAYWRFNSMSPLQSDAGCSSCNVGGYDGFGIALSRLVGVGGYSVTTWGASNSFPARTDRMWADKVSGYGVVFKGQDRFCRGGNGGCAVTDYSFFNGQLVFTMSNAGCGYLQAFPEYGHSWSSAELNGIGLGQDSISFSWTNAAYGWERSSHSPDTWVC